jgi:predicted DNA-binding transcriptional regulator YafY
MYFPTTRVLTVLEMLQSRTQMSGPELAERLEVDTRTVRRYITMLQDLGIPVESVRGRYGSYHLRPGYKLPPLMFNDDEVLALSLGLIAVRKIGLVGAAPAVEGALAKIERVLPEMLRERFHALQETLIFDFTPSDATPRGEVVSVLSTAAKQQRQTWIRYEAYGLVYRSGFWYLVGYCHLRADLRTFRLDRVLEAEMRQETFNCPLDFDALAHVIQSIPRTPAHWQAEVLLETTMEVAQQSLPPSVAMFEQAADGVVLRCNVNDLDWMAYLLAGLSFPFIVRQPVELRDALSKLAQNILEKANRTI